METGMQQQQPQAGGEWVGMDWLNDMDEESKKGSGFFKMAPTDEKRIEILTEPEKGLSNFDSRQQANQAAQNQQAQQTQPPQQQPQKAPRTVFRVIVQELGHTEKLTWEIGNRSVMQQVVAAVKNYRLKGLKGTQWLVKTSGSDMKNRAWFLMLLGAPGLNVQPFPAAATPTQDKGQAWLNEQRVGAQ